MNFRKAYGQNLSFRFLFVRNTPTQVDFAPSHPTRFTEFAQLWEDPFDQFFSFGCHVSEGRRDEHAYNAALRRQIGVNHVDYDHPQSGSQRWQVKPLPSILQSRSVARSCIPDTFRDQRYARREPASDSTIRRAQREGYLLEGIDWRLPQHTWRP